MTDGADPRDGARDGAPPAAPAAAAGPSAPGAGRDADAGDGPPRRAPRGTVTVRLARFEGPLDLLLHLIKRDEIDIYDIPIAHITQQYLAYIELMRALDLEVAGEFLVMAATLMRIKARMLLPLPASTEEDDEGDPREELVQRLVEYRQFKEAAGQLREREAERRRMFERGMVPGEDEAGPLPLAPVTLFDLLDALHRVLARVPEPQVYEVQGDVWDVEDKMALIASAVAERGSVPFTEMLLRCRARGEMIVTFMALLELIKLGQVGVVQEEAFGEILVVHRTPEGSEAHAAVEPAASD
uniref:Segregation and condensation protein A n=1 Tax=Eiseniibacteriota bacterium TaxID=2212470 RepID=A0A832MIL7_UNCEI